MTEDRKKQLAWMLTSVCLKNSIDSPCPFHAIDPYGEKLCPAGISRKAFEPPCEQITAEAWLRWMEKNDEQENTKAVQVYPSAL